LTHNVSAEMAERRAKRVKASRRIAVGFIAPNLRLAGYVENLSSRGMLLRCGEEVAPGTIGRMGVAVGHETIRIVAQVKNQVPGIGLAFDFLSMGPHDRELLHRLLLRLEKNL